MKKTAVWTVKVNNYRPDICEITQPTHRAYADMLDADYIEITERRYPNLPPPYEKLQVYELGKEYQWNIIVDADLMILNGMLNVTNLEDNQIYVWLTYPASQWFPCNKYFYRDKRNLGVCTNFIAIPSCCLDVLEPLNEEESLIMQNMIKRQFILDEYVVSSNLAKYGLKLSGILNGEQFKNPPLRHYAITSGKDSQVYS